MKRSLWIGFVTLLLSSQPALCGTPLVVKEMFEKPILAKPGQPMSCVYGTITMPDTGKSGMSRNFRFEKFPRQKRAAYLYFHLRDYRNADFRENGEAGVVMEACVEPGTYALTGISFSTQLPGSRPNFTMEDKSFKPIKMTLEAGKSYYVGNFHLTNPGIANEEYFVHSERLVDDTSLIWTHSRIKPDGDVLNLRIRAAHSQFLRPRYLAPD
jgi:hypothetical protein